MRFDSDGARLLTVVGPLVTPTYEDGRPVITPRLRARLTSLELDLYSGGLREHLARRWFHLAGNDTIDAWSSEDFIAYGLEKAIRQPFWTDAAVSTWVQQEFTRRKRKQAGYELRAGFEDEVSPDRGTRLSPEWLSWIRYYAGPEAEMYFRLVVDEGLTRDEAACMVGLTTWKAERHRMSLAEAWEEL